MTPHLGTVRGGRRDTGDGELQKAIGPDGLPTKRLKVLADEGDF